METGNGSKQNKKVDSNFYNRKMVMREYGHFLKGTE